MTPLVAALAVAALAAVAAAGVASGFRRRDPVPVEPLEDALEDRRAALLRSLADLEEARAAGALEHADYVRLRRDTEGRMARLLRAIDGRRATGPVAASAVSGGAALEARAPRRVPAWAVAVLLAFTVLAVAAAGSLRDTRSSAVASAPAAFDDPFAFYEDRVRDHPRDLAARLDLAHRYLDAGRIDEALDEYVVALDLDPDDAEARAHVGLILYLSERPKRALAEVDRALNAAPGYPEALFIRGVILLRDLDRPADAAEAFRAYLAAAPFGVERARARSLIAVAERELAGGEQPVP